MRAREQGRLETPVPRRGFLTKMLVFGGALLGCSGIEVPTIPPPRQVSDRTRRTATDFTTLRPQYLPQHYRFSHIIMDPPFGFRTGASEVALSYLKPISGHSQPFALLLFVVKGPATTLQMMRDGHGTTVAINPPLENVVYFDGEWRPYDGPQPERIGPAGQGFRWDSTVDNAVVARRGDVTVAVLGDHRDGVAKDELLAVLRSIK